jgi:hypothetical protein
MRPSAFLAIALLALAASAQAPSRTDYRSSQDVQTTLATLLTQSQTSGYASVKQFDSGSHSLALSVRRTSGGGEIHAHYDDIMIVVDGAATELTGGTVANAETSADGETRGSSVAGGEIRYIVVKIKEP